MSRPQAAERVARILAMVPWIAANDGPTIEAVCERFRISRDELVDDLNVVFVVGLYPYTPDNLIEVDLDDDRVRIDYTNFFERPLRLTPDEAFALVTAGLVQASAPGGDGPDGPGGTDGSVGPDSPNGTDEAAPLRRALGKVAAALGIDPDTDLGVVVDPSSRDIVTSFEVAVAERRVVEIDYFSSNRNERSERAIEPLRLFNDDGAWYVDAHCRHSNALRVFRLDRILDHDVTDEHFDARPARPDRAAFVPVPELPRVTLEIPSADRWMTEQYPVDAVEPAGDDRLRVVLAVAARPWFEQLLLRLGPGTTVVDAPEQLRGAGSDAAQRILARYR